MGSNPSFTSGKRPLFCLLLLCFASSWRYYATMGYNGFLRRTSVFTEFAYLASAVFLIACRSASPYFSCPQLCQFVRQQWYPHFLICRPLWVVVLWKCHWPSHLTSTNMPPFQLFFHSCNECVHEVNKRTKPIVQKEFESNDAISSVNSSFCVGPRWLESFIALGFIVNVNSVENLTDQTSWAYLDGKAEESKEIITVDALDDIICKTLRAIWLPPKASRESRIYSTLNTVC